MPNYTKLFNSIVTSTIWTEDDKTRIIWITMLAMSDKNGEVQASIPGLARLSGISIEDTEKAIKKLMEPDAYSRTPDHEGRRIQEIEGGWELLNHAKYREMASKADEKAKNAERQQRWRNRKKKEAVTDSNGKVTVGRDIADTDTDTDTDKKTPLNPPAGGGDGDASTQDPPAQDPPANPPPKTKRVRAQPVPIETCIELIPEEAPDWFRLIAIDWVEYRQSRKHYFDNEKSWLRQLKGMSKYPRHLLEKAVDDAIANQWQGWEQDRVKEAFKLWEERENVQYYRAG